MKLHYLTPLTFPSRYVNRLQVMKMSGAFSKRVDFALYIAESRMSRNDLFQTYNIHEPFCVEEVGNAAFLPRRFWGARRFLPCIRTAPEHTVWYARDVLLTDWLLFFHKQFYGNYFFELHTLSRFSEQRYRRVFAGARGIITTNEDKKKILMKRLGIDEHCVLVAYVGTDAKEYGTDALRHAGQLLQNTARIEIISGRPRNEALKYMAAADIWVASYCATSEHFITYMSPMKIREYMAMERPMIVSDLPSIRACVPSEAYAFFAVPCESSDLARAINEACANMEEARRRAKNAYHLLRAGGFSWDDRVTRIIDFIKTRV